MGVASFTQLRRTCLSARFRLICNRCPHVTASAFCQFLEQINAPVDQGTTFRTAPPMDMPFRDPCINHPIKFSGICQPHRKALGGMNRSLPGVVLIEPRLQIAGTADIVGTISTFEYVDPSHTP